VTCCKSLSRSCLIVTAMVLYFQKKILASAFKPRAAHDFFASPVRSESESCPDHGEVPGVLRADKLETPAPVTVMPVASCDALHVPHAAGPAAAAGPLAYSCTYTPA
jgi:hypothetical protein